MTDPHAFDVVSRETPPRPAPPPLTDQDLMLRIARLEMGPGDCLAVSLPHPMPEEQARRLSHYLANRLPPGARVVVLQRRQPLSP